MKRFQRACRCLRRQEYATLLVEPKLVKPKANVPSIIDVIRVSTATTWLYVESLGSYPRASSSLMPVLFSIEPKSGESKDHSLRMVSGRDCAI